MKTKIELGKSVNYSVKSLVYRSVYSSRRSSMKSLMDGSPMIPVSRPLWTSVYSSVRNSVNDIMLWNIEL